MKMRFAKSTPDFGLVYASTAMLDKQAYRAVVKDSGDKAVFVSIEVFRNRDITTSVSLSALDVAKIFVTNELKAIGGVRYLEGDYEHHYTGPAPFLDKYTAIYRCLNGYWFTVKNDRMLPTIKIPAEILRSAKAEI